VVFVRDVRRGTRTLVICFLGVLLVAVVAAVTVGE
jgi:hypothetical protein